MDSMQSQPAQTSLLVVWVLMTKAQMQTRSYQVFWSIGKRNEHTGHSEAVCFFVYFFIAFFYYYYLRLFPFFLAINAFGTTYLGWHVRLFLKQTSIQSLHLVASKVWIKLIKIKVYICPPYFTHKIKTLFWTPSKTGVLKYLTFVSQINVMTQKVKLKNCTKMIKFILKIVLWSNDALCVVLLTISLIKKKMPVYFFCWMKFRFTGCRTWGTSGKFGFGCIIEPKQREKKSLRKKKMSLFQK